MGETCWVLLLGLFVVAGLMIGLSVAVAALRRRVRVLETEQKKLKVRCQQLESMYSPNPLEAVQRDIEESKGRRLFFTWAPDTNHSDLMAIAEMAWLSSKLADAPLDTGNAQNLHPMLQLFERRPAHLVPKTPEAIRERLLKLVSEMTDYCDVSVTPRVTRIDIHFGAKHEDKPCTPTT